MVRTSLGTGRSWGIGAALLLVGALSCKSEPAGGDSSAAVGGAGGSAGTSASASTGGSHGEGGNGASSSGGEGGASGEGGERASSGGGSTATSSTGGNSTAATNTDSGGSNTGGSTGTDAGGTGGTGGAGATGGAGGGCVGCESSWGDPVELEHGGKIAMNEAGAAVLVWARYTDPLDIYDPNAYTVFASRYTPGEGWGAAEELGLGIDRYVAIDDEGNALVIWDNQPILNGYNELTDLSIWAKRYVVGVGWEATELVNPDSTDIGLFSDVAMAADGSALVVWTENMAEDEWSILSSYYQPGEGWGSAVPIGVGTQPLELQVALNPSGDALAIWRQEIIDDGSGAQEQENVWSSHSAAGSEWTTPEAIQIESSRQSYYESMHPDVAIDPEGNGIAVWNQLERVWTNRFDATVGWEGAELLSTSPNDAGHASVHMDADGNALAVWTQEDRYDCDIFARPYTLESGWGDRERVSPEQEDCIGYYNYRVAVGAAGDAVVLWQGQYRGYHWSHRYTPGLGWRGAEVFGDDRMSFRDLAVDGDGNAMVVWIKYDYDGYDDAALYSISTRPE